MIMLEFPSFFSNELRILLSVLHGMYIHLSRNSHLQVFCKKGVLRNFAKFTEKCLCYSIFFNKVAGLRPGTGVFL